MLPGQGQLDLHLVVLVGHGVHSVALTEPGGDEKLSDEKEELCEWIT